MTKVVLADDHAFIRAGVESVLSLSGFEVITAVDGTEALDIIARERPGAVILDLKMPKMNGVDVLVHLRATGMTMPVVLLSANITDEELMSALRADVRGIVFKDGAADCLIECLETVLRGERYIDPKLIDRALAKSLEPKKSDPLAELAPRQRDIALGVSKGLRNREIADQLAMTEGTVKTYLNAIYQKLGVTNRTSLALLIEQQRS